MKHASSKKIGTVVILAIIAQLIIISVLVYGRVANNFFNDSDTSGDWYKFLIAGLPLAIPSFVASHYISYYKYLPTVMRNTKTLTSIILGVLLFIVSLLIYISATVGPGIAGTH